MTTTATAGEDGRGTARVASTPGTHDALSQRRLHSAVAARFAIRRCGGGRVSPPAPERTPTNNAAIARYARSVSIPRPAEAGVYRDDDGDDDEEEKMKRLTARSLGED
ncbi:hypothetical protein MTO96_052307 [Rhipicephalus appendiculatus]